VRLLLSFLAPGTHLSRTDVAPARAQMAFKPIFARKTAFHVATNAIDVLFWIDICIQLNTAILGRFGTEIFSRRCAWL
jgi:hypothetical protein